MPFPPMVCVREGKKERVMCICASVSGKRNKNKQKTHSALPKCCGRPEHVLAQRPDQAIRARTVPDDVGGPEDEANDQAHR